MINLNDARSYIISSLNQNTNNSTYDAAFTGLERIDNRSEWSYNYLSENSHSINEISYSYSSSSIKINESTYKLRNLSSVVPFSYRKILIDATSLSFPELLHLFTLCDANKVPFDVIYVQPTEYLKSEPEINENNEERFQLSDDGIGPKQLPPFIKPLLQTDSSIFICLGFEGHRFGYLVQSDEYNVNQRTVLIGIPAFITGWENKTLEHNFSIINDAKNRGEFSYKFAAANDMLNIFNKIQSVYNSCLYLGKNFFIAPFGTKPAAISSAWFAVNNKNIGLIYDFVEKKPKRSQGTDMLHIWKFC